MTPPVRNINQAGAGQITSTPRRVLNKLGIRVFRVSGVRGRRRK